MARRVFFSFHYQDVIDFRANVVRNHNVTKDDNAGFFDASIWEKAKKEGDLALKRLINGGLNNTSLTAVLIGTHTYARPWVRYEILKSVERGNKIIGIHVNSIPGKDKQKKALGNNPFEYVAVRFNNDGTIANPLEYMNGKWINYQNLESFKITARPQGEWGQGYKLSYWVAVYDWIADNGFNNFSKWID